ncbi:EexN family lipoprotein [Sphingobium indicum]
MPVSCTVQAGIALAAVLLASSPAAGQIAGQGAARTPPKTVTWYADHRQQRAQVQLACLDDPGHLGRDPDCINAHAASVEVALRQTRARTGTLDPRDPAFWFDDPQNRQSKLLMCRRNPELQYCDVARRSLLIEAGQAR